MTKQLVSAIFWGLVFILAGVLMLLNSLGVIQFHIGDWWPAIFIVIGIQIVLDALFKKEK